MEGRGGSRGRRNGRGEVFSRAGVDRGILSRELEVYRT